MIGRGQQSFDAPEYVRREILRYALCPGTDDEAMLSIMEKCIDECGKKASFSYRVSYCVLPVTGLDVSSGVIDLDDITLSSRDLAGNLKGCSEVVLFAATVGPGIDRLIKKYTKLDPVKALFMQAIGAERVESLCNMFCDTFPQKLRPRYSPGFGDLSLSVQPKILSLTNATKNLSITLDEGCLMSPSKSVTAFAGIDSI
ncbi:MAG: Vitamin B12 dependent methionine synthase activation subunit [Lachnospiraceae bacterium]|nr:Vitamin B12 dependent methionine synthase activation subunit [Lachnospiraceae bacterium]